MVKFGRALHRVNRAARQGMSEVGQSVWLEEVGLGLTLWSGQFEEEATRLWLRWCDRNGQVKLPEAV